jgi:hypothetical protein
MAKSPKKKKNRLVIPHTVDDLDRVQSEVSQPRRKGDPSRAENATLSQDEIKEVARAIYELIQEKSVTMHGPSWQDVALFDSLMIAFVENSKRSAIDTSRSELAGYRAFYPNLPLELDATDLEIDRIKAKLQRENVDDRRLHETLLQALADAQGLSLRPEHLVPVDMTAVREAMIKPFLTAIHKSRWIAFIEGLLAGLITNGVYDILKDAVASLTMRAPYAEAQIYEVESDLIHWYTRKESHGEIAVTDSGSLTSHVLRAYTLHTLAVLGALGPQIPRNPLVLKVGFWKYLRD